MGDVWACRWPDISIHALLAESDGFCDLEPIKNSISIHALLAESDQTGLTCGGGQNISIHALLAESDSQTVTKWASSAKFLSTLSLRRATAVQSTINEHRTFLSTLSLRRATVLFWQSIQKAIFLSTLSLRRATPDGTITDTFFGISIHALLAESDQAANGLANAPPQISIHALLAESDNARPETRQPCVISIHALLAESDACIMTIITCIVSFLSTLSLRRATVASLLAVGRAGYFYPRSPCGERRARRASRQQPAGISIHALLAESDNNINSSVNTADKISIHALLAESDTYLSILF